MTVRLRTGVRTFRTPAPEADGTLRWDHTTAVTVLAESDHEVGLGWTYSSSAAAEVIDCVLAPVVSDFADPHPATAYRAMLRVCRNVGATGMVMQAISAVDIALWDLHGKQLERPLPDLWGRCRDRIPVYGSGGFITESAEDLRRQIEQWSAQGCTSMKIKIGQDRGGNIGRDLDRIDDFIDAAPTGTACMVDANGAYGPAAARRVGAALDERGIVWFEEPVSSDDIDGLHLLRTSLRADVAAGEYIWNITDAARLAGSVDCLQLDVTRCGGFTGWFHAAAIAASHHLDVSAHCAPALHAPVAAMTTHLRHIEHFADHARLEPQLVTGAPEVGAGTISANCTPGHGMELRA